MLCVFAALAQNKNADMQGYVKNIGNQPIAYASVVLLKATDSTVIKLAITNQTGLFKFVGIAPGKYLVKVSCTGYNSKLTLVNFLSSSIFNIVTIQLKKSNVDLAEIAVVENKNFVDVKPGKTTLNIHNSVFASGSTALDILRMSPGVQISNSDDISLNGKADVLILLDNKPTYLSGTALADLLRGTQSSMIDKIEIINNPNSTYDASGAGGVINIKLMRDKNLGFNAQINAGGGIIMSGISNYNDGEKGNAGINFNYRTKKLNVFGNYSYSNSAYFKSSALSRVNNYNGVVDVISDDWVINQRRVNNNFRVGADYNINPQHVIGFLLSGMFMDLNGPKNTISTINSLNSTDSTILTNSVLKRWQTNITYNLNYRGDLGKCGDITVDADYINYNRSYAEEFQSSYFYSNNITPYRNLILENNSPLNYDVYVFNASYHVNLNPTNNLVVGFKDSYAKADNFSDFGLVTNGVYNSLPLFTGRFKYTEMLYAGYIDYNHIFSKKSNLELGLRVEQTISDGLTPSQVENVHNNYIDFFPNVQYNYIVNNDNQLKMSYRRSINRPKYEELNPFLLYNDQYTYQIGNRYLKPNYSNTIAIDHVYKDRFSTSASFTVINGFTQTVYMQNDQTQITTLKKINLGNRYNYDLVFIAPITFTKWYAADFNLDMLYQRFTATNGTLDNGSTDITLKVAQHFKLPLSMKADITAQYETPTTYGIFRYKSNFFAFGAISKSVLKNKGAIQLQVDNIFQSDKNVYTSHYQNLNISGTQVNIFRSVQLSFTYIFGSQTIKAARKSTGADEEQGRVGNSTN
ncbi:MAG: TonB dependent receptor [Mucilaginibacter sp.]|uniref:TonB dependent receptor n=1 Tax=Mucilaginibacter sp. TaxID=1882438 RepID=UPI003263F98C